MQPPRPTRRAGMCGLSVLELLVVLILIGAATATAMLGYRPMLARWRLNAAARQVVMDLKIARAEAIAESVDHRIHFPVPGTDYQLENRPTADRYEPAGPPRALPRGVETIACSARGSNVTFRPRGHASTFGAITLRNVEGDQLRLIVDMAGRMRIQ